MKKGIFSNQKFVILGIGLFMSVLITTLYIYQPYAMRQLDRIVYDTLLRNTADGKISPTPAIVDIDEESLEAYGQWPWPRHLLAQLLKILTESNAASIGLDIMFAEADRSSPLILQKSLKDSFNVDLSFQGLPRYLEDNDKLFASVVRQTPTVLGTYVQFDGELAEQNASSAVASKEISALPDNLPRYEGVMERIPPNALSPLETITKGAGAVLPLPVLIPEAPLASLNVAPDPDGIVRSIPLVLKVEDRIFISLGLRALMRALNLKNIALEGGPYGLNAIYVGKYRIPVSPNGLFQIPFQGPRGTYPYYSAKDILDGKVPAEELAGRVLLVGTSASGLLDIRATPFDPIFPGVESHAAVVDAILSERSIIIPTWTPFIQVSFILFMGLLSTILFGFAPALVYIPSFLLFAGGSAYSSWYAFGQNLFISPQYALLTVISIMIILLGVRFVYEAQQKRQLRKAFSRYVSPEMVNRIADRGEVVLAGEEREVTLIFTDIRGFTSIAEQLAPADMVGVLNRYFTPMTGLIQETQGTVDKFIGDAIMAFWNAPLDVVGHELKAVKTALGMHKALDNLNVELEEEFNIKLRMGAGIHTGKVYVGNMGSEELLDYTCIGDTVNLSSRLEGMCSHYGVGIVVSSITANRCKESLKEELIKTSARNINNTSSVSEDQLPIRFVALDTIRVKGKEEPVDIMLPILAEEAQMRSEELNYFARGREYYKNARFADALPMFKKLQLKFPETKIYSIYTERCTALLEDHPKNWDGVWRFDKK